LLVCVNLHRSVSRVKHFAYTLCCFCIQGRQKLAKFNKREFATLIIDILNDAKRRYGTGAASPTNNITGQSRGNYKSFISVVIFSVVAIV